MADEVQVDPVEEPVVAPVAEAPAPAVDEAEEPVVMAEEPAEPMPAEISDQVPVLTPEGTMERVKVWLAEARYFISTLEHEVQGDAGEIIAWLKARL